MTKKSETPAPDAPAEIEFAIKVACSEAEYRLITDNLPPAEIIRLLIAAIPQVIK